MRIQISASGIMKMILILTGLLKVSELLAVHPADSNADGRIDMGEVSVTASRWSAGDGKLSEEDMLSANRIWRMGEAYEEIAGVELPYGYLPMGSPPFIPLGAERAEPFDWVSLLGLEGENGLSVRCTILGYPYQFQAQVRQDESGAWSVLVPLNPFAMGGGGMVLFLLENETGAWRAGPLHIAELPDAPGATQAFTQKVSDQLEAYEQLLGEDLLAYHGLDMDQIPDGLGPLVMLSEAVRADFSNSLTRLADGSAAVYDEAGLSPALMDRIIAKLGLHSVEFRTPTYTAKLLGKEIPSGHYKKLSYERIIADAFELSEAMLEQKAAADSLADPVTSNTRDYSQHASKTLEVLARKFPKLADKVSFFSAIGDVLVLKEFFDTYGAYTLPSEFSSLDLWVEDAEGGSFFYEDAYSPNCDEAFLKGRVTAQSIGLDWNEVYDFDITSPIRTLNYKSRSLLGWDIPPQEWTVDIIGGSKDGSQYVEVQSLNGVLQVNNHMGDGDGVGFQAMEVGTGSLDVQLTAGLFGGRSIRAQENFPVRPLKISMISGPERVSPMTPVTYRVSLENAWYRELDAVAWEVSAGVPLSTYKEGDEWILEWQSSDREDDYPVVISAFTTADGCLRSGKAPEKASLSVQLKEEGFFIAPNTVCLFPGSSQDFDVVSTDGGPGPEVSWSVVSGGEGSIDQDGIFRASESDKQIITIRATPLDSNLDYQELTFGVGCGAWINFQFDPAILPLEQGQTYSIADNVTVTTILSVGSSLSGSVRLDGKMTVLEIVPTEEENTFRITASFAGAGIFLPLDMDLLRDDRENNKKYPIPGTQPSPDNTYSMQAEIGVASILPDLGNDRSVAMAGTESSPLLRVGLTGEGSYSPYGPLNYHWFLPNNEAAGRETVAEFDANLNAALAILVVTDAHSNSAEQGFYIPPVRASGELVFEYHTSGELQIRSPYYGHTGLFIRMDLKGGYTGSFTSGATQMSAGVMEVTGEGERFVIIGQ